MFFPKQSNKDYVISLKGMGRGERIFSFSPSEAPQEQKKPDVVVVNVPKRQPRKQPPVIPSKKQTPVPPPPPAIPPRPITPIFQQESSDMADFVKSVKERGSEKPKESAPVQASPPQRQSNIDNAYVSRESVLRRFMNFWAEGSYGEMYDMLSEGSKKILSRENFAKEAAKASDIRAGIKGGDVRIDWLGDERAKIITTHKTLIFRSVSTRTIGVTREGSSWRVVW